ncbi:ABC-type branched-chain amino acid transport system, periplasmic component [Synechococcus sp. PCC 7502]|uniref:ABC transporter substrate-binding protein n=1 Tax=Synechococcus sp. PCC 7502 TaxID=1173263 RepID=UPI00029F8BB9|nr:ABC transporter substrate-binding protein [Synechococcus sp. PCC 7502]AFY72868.1 ABC-type branched-chain amino acid transport system, periplasmic component [Synechococcus sp. PCC 7502]
MFKSITSKIIASCLGLITCFWIVACQPETPTPPTATVATDQLRLGIVLPATGDLASIGAPMVKGIDFLIDTVNNCGGVLGKPIQVFKEDDRTEPTAGAEAVTKLVQVDKVGAIVGSFASSVSTAGIAVAAPNKVVMISPGSTSPVFTERAKKGDFDGYWYRTAPPDTYQAAALANLAYKKGFRKVSTVVINNDYGVGFEKVFVAKFKELGGQILNEAKPTRYDPKATTFEAEARSAFGGKPDAVAAVLYPETGAPLIKSAYEQGLTEGVTIMLTDGVQTEDFPKAIGKSASGKLILEGAIGTVPGASGKSLDTFSKAFTAKTSESVGAFVPHSYDAAALVALAAESAKSGSGEAIKSKIREVANPPGTEVTDVCEALKLVKAGTEINYQGASGNVDLDELGDVKGSYDVWTVEPTGKIKVIDKVSP